MKKIAAIIIVLLLYAELANAQSPWSLGLTFQPSRYRLYNRTENEAPADLFGVVKPGIFEITGWAAGITAGHRFTKNIAIETELTWSTQEQKFEWQDYPPYPYYFSKINTKLNYLKLPVLFKYIIPLNANNFYIKAGFQLSFLTNYEERFKVDGGVGYEQYANNDRIWYSIPDDIFECDWLYKRFVFGVVGGLGYEQLIMDGKISLNIGLRYEFDLTNADNLGARFYSSIDEPGFPLWYSSSDIWRLYRAHLGWVTDQNKIAPVQSRKASHNIRFGLELGVKFHFGKKTYRIKKVNANW